MTPPPAAPARHPFLFRVQMGLKKKNEGQISHGPKGLLVRQQVILPDSVTSKQARSDADLFEMERNQVATLQATLATVPPSPCLLSVDPAGPRSHHTIFPSARTVTFW